MTQSTPGETKTTVQGQGEPLLKAKAHLTGREDRFYPFLSWGGTPAHTTDQHHKAPTDKSHLAGTPAQQEPCYVFCECSGRTREHRSVLRACSWLPSLTAARRPASPHLPSTCDTSLPLPRPNAARLDNRSHA
jgi:hypothetical protein